jgi:methionine synthase I (cobalamin-dependent)
MMTMDVFLERRPLLLDGAWGTQLQARGLPLGACPDEWNLSHPAAVEDVARAYVEAGSDIILTNTFGANRIRLKEFGLVEKTGEINRAGAAISRRAGGERALVFASIGPSGELLAMGDVSESELEDAFAEQAQALHSGGADGLVIETMGDPTEAAIAVRAAKATGLLVAACLTFDTGTQRDRTMMGTTPEEGARALVEAGADIIGANCGNGIEGFLLIAKRLKAATDRPLWLKANAGLPTIVNGQTVYPTNPKSFAAGALQLIEAGASFVGGCCGTTPEHIRSLHQMLGERK